MIYCTSATGFPDKNFNKKPNSANMRPEKGQTDCLKARKKPNFICGIAILLSQKIYELQEYQKNFLQNQGLNFAWHCTGALMLIFPDFSWFVKLHSLGKMMPRQCRISNAAIATGPRF